MDVFLVMILYASAIIGGCTLIFVLYSIILNKFRKNEEMSVTELPFFVNKIEFNKPWYTSKIGNLEKQWLEDQEKLYEIDGFEIIENFNELLIGSKFIKLRAYLTGFMPVNNIGKTIKLLKNYVICLENIWFLKYRDLCIDRKVVVAKASNSPEFHYYKYHFIFLSAFRQILMEALTKIIIPAVLTYEIAANKIKEKKLKVSVFPENVFDLTYNNVALKVEELWDLVCKKQEEEMKVDTVPIDYNSSKNELLKKLRPLMGLDRIYYENKFEDKTTKISIKEMLLSPIKNAEEKNSNTDSLTISLFNQ